MVTKEEYRGVFEQLKELGYTGYLKENSNVDLDNLMEIQKWLMEEKGVTIVGLYYFFAADDEKVSYYIRRNERNVYASPKRWSGERLDEELFDGIKTAIKILKEGK